MYVMHMSVYFDASKFYLKLWPLHIFEWQKLYVHPLETTECSYFAIAIIICIRIYVIYKLLFNAGFFQMKYWLVG